MESLRRVLPELHEIHFTGGEPTHNPELAAITAGLTALGLEVKTTTNGQFTPEDLERLMSAGLRSFNFSIHSLDPHSFLETQTGRGMAREMHEPELHAWAAEEMHGSKLRWAERQVERELAMIREAHRMGASVKLNTVVSGERNLSDTRKIFEWSKAEGVPLRLLNDLGAGMESVLAIRQFIRSLEAQEVLRQVTIGSSACSTVYRLPGGYELVFKQIRDFKLESMCRNCPRAADGTCQEQYYGIRLQKKRDGQFHVNLCLQESGPQSDMTLEQFLRSPQLREIQSYLI